jgi:hypothetical protein
MTTLQIVSLFAVPVGALVLGLGTLWLVRRAH